MGLHLAGGVPQISILGTAQVNIFISDLAAGAERILSKFADVKLGSAADSL